MDRGALPQAAAHQMQTGVTDAVPNSAQTGQAWRVSVRNSFFAADVAVEAASDTTDDMPPWSLADRAAEIQTPERPVPPFAPAADGTPATWNLPHTRHCGAWPPSTRAGVEGGGRRDPGIPLRGPATEIDIRGFLKSFLDTRPAHDGSSLLRKLGEPAPRGEGWFRLDWLPFNERALNPTGHWLRGWHGCKMEALYSIMFHGGERFFSASPGIYMFNEARRHKAETYCRFVPMTGDGLFWCAKWETAYDLNQSAKAGKSTDQTIIRPDGVHLQALWLCARCVNTMEHGTWYQRRWDALHEGHPGVSLAANRAEVLRSR